MILVTGATGFIGRAVVARLLAAGRPVAVIARSRDDRDARSRVAAVLGGAEALARVEVVEGDLAGDGPAVADLRRLRGRVETVIHCAGDTSFTPEAWAPYVAGHVHGPAALLRALAGGRLARWAHLSTAFVCGERSGLVRESEGDTGQRFHNVYERVKLEAEGVIRATGRAVGIDVRVLRPSIVERVGARGLRLLDATTEPLRDPSPLERRVARMLDGYRAYLAQDVRFDDRAAAAALAPTG